MSVSSISSTGTQQLWQLIAAASQTQSTSENDVQAIGTTTESLDLSEPGKIFNKLKELSESDPEKFKTVMTEIADEIQNAAESSSDENESNMLMKVAEGFQNAAESGDLSEALPKGKGPPPSGTPPSSASDNTNEGKINAYTQAQYTGSGGFSTVLNIINEVLDKNTTA